MLNNIALYTTRLLLYARLQWSTRVRLNETRWLVTFWQVHCILHCFKKKLPHRHSRSICSPELSNDNICLTLKHYFLTIYKMPKSFLVKKSALQSAPHSGSTEGMVKPFRKIFLWKKLKSRLLQNIVACTSNKFMSNMPAPIRPILSFCPAAKIIKKRWHFGVALLRKTSRGGCKYAEILHWCSW